MKIKNNKFKLCLLLVAQICSLPIQARYYWYQPAPVVVYQEPSIVDGVVAAGACVGLGIAAIVKSQAKKRKFKEYIYTFRDMGYSREQAKIYAQMAMDNPEGLQAVVRNIDQEKLAQLQTVAQHEFMEKAHDQKLEDMKESHSQKLQQMSHEYKLKLLTGLVMFLATVILAGIGFLLYRKK